MRRAYAVKYLAVSTSIFLVFITNQIICCKSKRETSNSKPLRPVVTPCVGVCLPRSCICYRRCPYSFFKLCHHLQHQHHRQHQHLQHLLCFRLQRHGPSSRPTCSNCGNSVGALTPPLLLTPLFVTTLLIAIDILVIALSHFLFQFLSTRLVLLYIVQPLMQLVAVAVAVANLMSTFVYRCLQLLLIRF